MEVLGEAYNLRWDIETLFVRYTRLFCERIKKVLASHQREASYTDVDLAYVQTTRLADLSPSPDPSSTSDGSRSNSSSPSDLIVQT